MADSASVPQLAGNERGGPLPQFGVWQYDGPTTTRTRHAAGRPLLRPAGTGGSSGRGGRGAGGRGARLPLPNFASIAASVGAAVAGGGGGGGKKFSLDGLEAVPAAVMEGRGRASAAAVLDPACRLPPWLVRR